MLCVYVFCLPTLSRQEAAHLSGEPLRRRDKALKFLLKGLFFFFFFFWCGMFQENDRY